MITLKLTHFFKATIHLLFFFNRKSKLKKKNKVNNLTLLLFFHHTFRFFMIEKLIILNYNGYKLLNFIPSIEESLSKCVFRG